MKLLIQVGILFSLCWVSQCIESVLPFAFPASVIGLILLLILLLTGILKVDHIREKSDFLLANLQFFFIPVSVGVMEYAGVIVENGLAFITICLVSLILTYGATAWAVNLTVKWMNRKEAAKCQ